MTNPLHARMASTAQNLIAGYGQPVVLTHVETGLYDPATSESVNLVSSETVQAVETVDYEKDIDGTNILLGDKKLIMSSAVVAPPKVDDRVTVGGLSYNIVNVNPISPGGVVIYYEVRARK